MKDKDSYKEMITNDIISKTKVSVKPVSDIHPEGEKYCIIETPFGYAPYHHKLLLSRLDNKWGEFREYITKLYGEEDVLVLDEIIVSYKDRIFYKVNQILEEENKYLV
jgi:hypothetical protein